MSYQVLARRKRPQNFADVLGQDVVVRTLRNALQRQEIAHAYLFTGIRGVGKTTLARLFAMSVNCKQFAGDPCGQCASCTSIRSGQQFDVIEMDAASHTGIDDVRELLDSVRYPPTSMRYKVYIIDEVHMLSKSAFNGLLKTLEEPPEHVLFILATTEAEKLPITVRSRCLRFDLRRLSLLELRDYLTQILQEEGHAFEAAAVHAIAEAADGSARDALSLCEQVLAYASGKLDVATVEQALGQLPESFLYPLSEAIFAGECKTAVQLMRQALAHGVSGRCLFERTAALWHALSCVAFDDALMQEELSESAQQWCRQSLQALTPVAIDMRYQVLLQGLRDLHLMDERRGSEMLLIRLCLLAQWSTKQASTRSKQAKVLTAKPASETVVPKMSLPKPKSVEKKAPKPSSEDGQLSLGLHEGGGRACQQWSDAVQQISDRRIGLGAKLKHIRCLAFDPQQIRLALSNAQQQMFSVSERQQLAAWFGREVLWEALDDEQKVQTLAEEKRQQAADRQAQLHREAEQDPVIQMIAKGLDAKLIDVKLAGTKDDNGE